MGAIEKLEKAPLQSKKFIAYLISNLGSKLMVFWMVLRDESDFAIVSAIVASSFLDVGYVLGQAALDKYVRVASMKGEGSQED